MFSYTLYLSMTLPLQKDVSVIQRVSLLWYLHALSLLTHMLWATKLKILYSLALISGQWQTVLRNWPKFCLDLNTVCTIPRPISFHWMRASSIRPEWMHCNDKFCAGYKKATELCSNANGTFHIRHYFLFFLVNPSTLLSQTWHFLIGSHTTKIGPLLCPPNSSTLLCQY